MLWLWPRPSVAAAVGLEIAAPDQPIDHLVGNLNRPEKQSEPALAADLFNQKVEGIAWKMKPSWYVLATKDRTVHPEFRGEAHGATIVEVASSPDAVERRPRARCDPQGRSRRSKCLEQRDDRLPIEFRETVALYTICRSRSASSKGPELRTHASLANHSCVVSQCGQ